MLKTSPRRRQYLLLHACFGLCALLLLCSSNALAAGGYSIVLASAPGSELHWQPSAEPIFRPYTFYVTQVSIDGSPWERLCLGDFDTRQQALAMLDKARKVYPSAWIQKTQAGNKRILRAAAKSGISQKQTRLSEKQLDSLMQRARNDITRKRYSSAIRYLTAVISAGEHKYLKEALELQGLARQRKGQNAHAVAIYEEYLRRYPEGDDAERVRQRLAGLLTARRAPRDKLKMQTTESRDSSQTYGSLSQFYRNSRTSTNDTGSFTTLSQLITFLDVANVHQSSHFDHRYQFTGDHTYDFIDQRKKSEFRFIETFYEFSYRKTGSSGRVGRQALRIGGILQRFDGLSAGYQFTPSMRLNLLGGFPVDIDNKTSINHDKQFYGLTFETGTFLKHWDMNLFYFDQHFNGLQDRQSVGTEARYFDKTRSFFGMVDYDLFFHEVNILQFNANLLFPHGRTAYINAFMRKTPVLAAANALTGRPERSLDQLKQNLNIEQIYQLAHDRTANSQTITVGGSLPVSRKFQANTDITLSRVGGTVASGGVDATEGTGTDLFFSAQLVGNNLLKKRDTGVLGIRYYKTRPSDTISFIANSRFPVTALWRINPRLQYDIRKLSDGRSQRKLRMILRTDYQYRNNTRFDFEIGYDDTSENINGQSLGSNELFFLLGYRWDF